MMFNEMKFHVYVDYCVSMMILEVLTCMLSWNKSLMSSIKHVESCMIYVSYDMLCFMIVYVLVNEGGMNVHLYDLKVIIECRWWNGTLFMHCTNCYLRANELR